MPEKEFQEAIVKFLEERFGYRNIRDFLTNTRNGLNLERLHLDGNKYSGTIMGTFSRGQKYLESEGYSPKDQEESWSVKYPYVSKINNSADLERLASNRRPWYLRIERGRFRRIDELIGELNKRNYYINHGASFLNMTSLEVKNFVESLTIEFPDSKLDYSPDNGFSVFLKHPEFCLYSSGQRTKQSNKVFVFSFNLLPEIVKDINELRDKYIRRMEAIIKSREIKESGDE